jgi:hypothetical protein
MNDPGFERWWLNMRPSEAKAALSAEEWASMGWHSAKEAVRQEQLSMRACASDTTSRQEVRGAVLFTKPSTRNDEVRAEEGRIPATSSAMRYALSELDEVLRALEARLGPVLRPVNPVPPSPDCAEKRPSDESDVYQMIWGWAMEVRGSISFVKDLLGRCDL